MKVLMHKTACGPSGQYFAGKVCEVPDKLAEKFIKAHAATPVDKREAQYRTATKGSYGKAPKGDGDQ